MRNIMIMALRIKERNFSSGLDGDGGEPPRVVEWWCGGGGMDVVCVV